MTIVAVIYEKTMIPHSSGYPYISSGKITISKFIYTKLTRLQKLMQKLSEASSWPNNITENAPVALSKGLPTASDPISSANTKEINCGSPLHKYIFKQLKVRQASVSKNCMQI